jgi:hypothetical protein
MPNPDSQPPEQKSWSQCFVSEGDYKRDLDTLTRCCEDSAISMMGM